MRALLYLFCSFFISANAHDTPIAFFKIYKSEKKIVLEIIFDTEDLSKELKITTNELELNSFQSYLEKHTNFEFDSCTSKPIIKEITRKNGHTKLYCIFNNVADFNTTIFIENDCLNSIDNHSNIIKIENNSSLREFRMHKNRTKINVDLYN